MPPSDADKSPEAAKKAPKRDDGKKSYVVPLIVSVVVATGFGVFKFWMSG